MLEKKEIDSLDDLPTCCGAQVDSIHEIAEKSGCCSSSAEKSTACGGCCAGTGSGCCSGGVEGEKEQPKLGPLRIRTGGLGVVVCGPSSMIVRRSSTQYDAERDRSCFRFAVGITIRCR